MAPVSIRVCVNGLNANIVSQNLNRERDNLSSLVLPLRLRPEGHPGNLGHELGAEPVLPELSHPGPDCGCGEGNDSIALSFGVPHSENVLCRRALGCVVPFLTLDLRLLLTISQMENRPEGWS